MKLTIDVPAYEGSRGLRFEWEDDSEIALTVGATEVVISANPSGLVSLARHLLTLAQDGVPAGHHLHLTANQEVDSSVDLVLERTARS